MPIPTGVPITGLSSVDGVNFVVTFANGYTTVMTLGELLGTATGSSIFQSWVMTGGEGVIGSMQAGIQAGMYDSMMAEQAVVNGARPVSTPPTTPPVTPPGNPGNPGGMPFATQQYPTYQQWLQTNPGSTYEQYLLNAFPTEIEASIAQLEANGLTSAAQFLTEINQVDPWLAQSLYSQFQTIADYYETDVAAYQALQAILQSIETNATGVGNYFTSESEGAGSSAGALLGIQIGALLFADLTTQYYQLVQQQQEWAILATDPLGGLNPQDFVAIYGQIYDMNVDQYFADLALGAADEIITNWSAGNNTYFNAGGTLTVPPIQGVIQPPPIITPPSNPFNLFNQGPTPPGNPFSSPMSTVPLGTGGIRPPQPQQSLLQPTPASVLNPPNPQWTPRGDELLGNLLEQTMAPAASSGSGGGGGDIVSRG